MAIKASDIYVQECLLIALDDIRKNSYLMNDIMSDVVDDPILNEKFGQEEVNKLKLFLSKEISIGQIHNTNAASVPGIGIEIQGGSENTSSTGDPLADGYKQEYEEVEYFEGVINDNDKTYRNLTALSYEPSTGKISINQNIQLFEGMIVIDEQSHKEYPIILVDDDTTFYIEASSTPNLNNFTIKPPKKRYKNIRKRMIFNESIKLTLATTSAAELIYLYNTVIYILGRYKLELFETRNFRVSTINYGPIYEILADTGNRIFARDINMNGQVTHTFIAYTDKNLLGSKPRLTINGMTKTPDNYLQDAKKQGWESPEDL